MAVPKFYTTEKGTELPLLNLRGKPYLQIAHRLVWLTEKYNSYTIETSFLRLDDEHAIARSEITLFNDDGSVLKKASATKKETKKDFPDFVEKAETGASGRALSKLGIGTQFCTQDMDEGKRLADAPVKIANKVASISKPSSFNKKSKSVKERVAEEVADKATASGGNDGGWE